MVALRWLAKPRLNYIDAFWLAIAWRVAANGYWWSAAAIAVLGIVFSTLAEMATGGSR